jgi:hypothetical protein
MAELVLHDPLTYARGFPYDAYADLRDNDPVSRHTLPNGKPFWAIARHADVQRVSRDSEGFANAPHPFIDSEADGEDAGTS